VRTFSYRLDTHARVIERRMRDPQAPKGTYFRDQYRWNQDGSYSVQTYRHHATEGPYEDQYQRFDASGRLDRRCSQNNFCEMIEYNGHGHISRIRQQNEETHFYLTHDNTYDKTGRLTTRKRGNSTVHYDWNQRGDVIEERGESGGAVRTRSVYAYDYR
jgi:hypothetical protein